jgi:hypothetical protein
MKNVTLSPKTVTAPQFLYILNRDRFNPAAAVNIDLFQVDPSSGTLTRFPAISGVPSTATGLAAKL